MAGHFLTVAASLILATRVQAEAVHPAPPLPEDWLPSNGVVLDDDAVTLRFSLRQQNLDKLFAIARQVSNPQSISYGQYLTSEEIKALTKPSDSDIKAVQSWLGARNVAYTEQGSNGFEVRTSVKAAKALLQTDFYEAANMVTKQQVVLATSYQLPQEVDAIVTSVYGLHGLPLPPHSALSQPPAKPADVTPDVLTQTYNVSGVSPSGSTKNRQAVAEFQGQTIELSDLEQFFKSYMHGKGSASIYKFVGDKGIGNPGGESSLDVDYIMGAAPGVLTEFWYWKNNDFCGDLVNWTNSILDAKDPPLVHSVSYGWQGNLSQLHCTQANIDEVDANFAKLAARGISLIIASGDSGSGYTSGGAASCMDSSKYAKDKAVDQGELYKSYASMTAEVCCIISQQKSWTLVPETNGASRGKCSIYASVKSTKAQSGAVSGGHAFTPQHQKPVLWPSWPASSPWVTSVGATRFVDNKVGSAEMATDQFGSGGGFSKQFDAFQDQKNAVQNYLKTVTRGSTFPPDGSFPTGGRATPDISALGEGYQVVQSGRVQSVGGTSASTPAFAGFVSLLNEARQKAGKPAMGYLNPFLYQNPDAFRDVTVGTNAIGHGTGPIAYGYPCAPGWDPATGLGTPNFAKLLARAMATVGVEDSIVV